MLDPTCTGSKNRDALEAEIARQWSPKRGDGMVFLSARTGMDLLFAALELPKGSEVPIAIQPKTGQ